MTGVQQVQTIVGAALAGCLLTLLISGCGGSSKEASAPAAKEAAHAEREAEMESKHSTTSEQPPEKGGSSPNGAGAQSHSQSQQAPVRSEPVGSGGEACPGSMSRPRCTEASRAYEEARGESRQAQANECPPAMSQQACKEAGEVTRQGADDSHVVTPGECPAAMTKQQCAEAGRVYEEAIK